MAVADSRSLAGAGVSLAAAVVIAALVALVATRNGMGRPAPTELLVQPWKVPYVEFNANEGSAGPAHSYAALGFQSNKASASQEWLQYSLHHDGTVQQARRPRKASKLQASLARAAAASASSAQSAHISSDEQKKGIIDTSGNFKEDDGSLFGDSTFDKAEESPGKPMPYQQDDTHKDDDDYYCVDEKGNEVPCGDDFYCVDEQGHAVPCEDEYCVDEQGNDVPCDEPEEPAGPSDFLTSIVNAVSSEELPPDASLVLKKVENSVLAAKKELKAAAKLKAEASIEEKKAQGLEGRVAELEEYQGKKEKFAEAAEDLARKADEEYAAEEDQVKEMNGDERAAGDSGQITASIRADQNGEVALRRRLQRHLPLLRVVDKLAQRVGAVKGRGLHPRSRHQLPSKSRVR